MQYSRAREKVEGSDHRAICKMSALIAFLTVPSWGMCFMRNYTPPLSYDFIVNFIYVKRLQEFIYDIETICFVSLPTHYKYLRWHD